MSMRLYFTRCRCQYTVFHTTSVLCLLSVLSMAGCGSLPKAPPVTDAGHKRVAVVPNVAPSTRETPILPAAGSGRGGYYLDDGPGEAPPPGLAQTPDPEPRIEPYARSGNRPYVVFGKTYTPLTDGRALLQRGVGSWYGKKFHGQRTSSGERYDMYRMTAAHPTLPIPSYARVTNLDNGRQVIVRVNDRGPFHSSRIIDLSYTAALKLGYIGKGSTMLEVERLLPDEIERIAQGRRTAPLAQQVTQAEMVAVPEPVATVQYYPELPVVLTVAEPVLFPARPYEPAALGMSAPSPAASLTMPLPVPLAGAYYLQFGVYAQADNADLMRQKLSREWATVLPPLEVVQNGLHHRLFSGPFASRDQAAEAAQRLQEAGSVKALVVQR